MSNSQNSEQLRMKLEAAERALVNCRNYHELYRNDAEARLAQCVRERDEARAQAVRLREAVNDAQKWAARWASLTEHRDPNKNTSGPYQQHPHGYAICPIPDWEVKQKRDDYASTLVETPAQSLEATRAEAGRERAVRELNALLTNSRQRAEEALQCGLMQAACAIGIESCKIGQRRDEIAKEK